MNKNAAIQAIIAECYRHDLTMPEQVAYVLATVEHETAGTFQPVEEGFYLGKGAKKFQRSLRYYPYYGRGYVQLTWLKNYEIYTDLLKIDLVNDPELALREDVALFVLVDGFACGRFTGKKLTDYINAKGVNFYGARRCINGTDRARHIAMLAEEWLRKIPHE